MIRSRCRLCRKRRRLVRSHLILNCLDGGDVIHINVKHRSRTKPSWYAGLIWLPRGGGVVFRVGYERIEPAVAVKRS